MSSRHRLLLLALLIATALAPHGRLAAAEAVTTVPSVDLARYTGLWFEVARIPNRFQKQCARESLALYSLRTDGRLKVVNQCRRKNGQVDQARGVARVIDSNSRARLKVSLVSFLGLRPFWGDYWILGLDDNYRWAVVGSPDRRYGWILARTPTLERSTMEIINAIIERNGFRREAFASTAP
jgi:apolipoprotein D and lipocalin family protein